MLLSTHDNLSQPALFRFGKQVMILEDKIYSQRIKAATSFVLLAR